MRNITWKMCLFNPANIRADILLSAIKDMPVRIIPTMVIETILFVDTNLPVKKKK